MRRKAFLEAISIVGNAYLLGNKDRIWQGKGDCWRKIIVSIKYYLLVCYGGNNN